MKGVRWFAVPPGNGYGDASENYLSCLRRAGVPVWWSPLCWHSTPWGGGFGPAGPTDGIDLGETAHADLVDLAVDHDVVMMHSTPHWQERLAQEAAGRRLLAYSTWETDRLRPVMVEQLNRFERVLVPSRFNQAVFEASGVSVPVVVVPHCLGNRPPAAAGDIGETDRFVFYTVGTWASRKAVFDIVEAFLRAFDPDEAVELAIHASSPDLVAGARVDRGEVPASRHADAPWRSLAQFLAGRGPVPPIRLSTHQRSSAGIGAFHERGHCFVGLSRGEGWGLGAFEAGARGNPVIITNWGGWLDYMPAGYPYLVDADLVPTLEDPADRWWAPVPGESWARARVAHAAALMRRVYERREEAARWGQTLRHHIETRFSMARIGPALLGALAGELPAETGRADPGGDPSETLASLR